MVRTPLDAMRSGSTSREVSEGRRWHVETKRGKEAWEEILREETPQGMMDGGVDGTRLYHVYNPSNTTKRSPAGQEMERKSKRHGCSTSLVNIPSIPSPF